MKTRTICVAVLLTVLASAAFASVNTWPWMSPTPKLQFRTKGEELTAFLPLTVNNSPAIVETSVAIDKTKKVVSLGFVVIQNHDLYNRSMRRIALEWQLGKIKQEDYTFHIKGSTVVLKTERLRALLPANVPDKKLKATR